MMIKTTSFGELEIDKESILSFKEGIPGFIDEKEFFIILNEDGENPLNYLQSAKTPELAFIIVNPFDIYDDYDILLTEAVLKRLDLRDEEDLAVYTIVSIPDDIDKMTTNLLGPIIINTKNRRAKQIILDDDKYSTRHYLFKQEDIKGEDGGRE